MVDLLRRQFELCQNKGLKPQVTSIDEGMLQTENFGTMAVHQESFENMY